jgi:hypothetical protein
MNLLPFLLSFLILLVIGSLCIVGFYIITRGQKETQADGTIKRTGKVFKGWSLFWEQQVGYQKIYYNGPALKEKLKLLQQWNDELAQKIMCLETPEGYKLLTREKLAAPDVSYIKDALSCEIEYQDNETLKLYELQKDYVFPEWVRFPLSQCPPCMASIGGTLLYWPIMLQVDSAGFWSLYPGSSLLFFWVVYCCSLAALNKFFYNVIGGG